MDWAFCQPKKTGGHFSPSPPNLAISSQKAMKLGKGRDLYKWVEIFKNWQKFLMTSSSCWFYDVIKMRLMKNSRFSSVLAEYLKNGPTDFHQIYPMFRQLYIKVLKLKDWRQIIHCCHGNQFMRECWAKNHDLREEKWNFLKIANRYCIFESRFEIRSLKLPLTPNFSLIHPKTKKQWRLSTSWVVTTSKLRLRRHTLDLEMTSSKFF